MPGNALSKALEEYPLIQEYLAKMDTLEGVSNKEYINDVLPETLIGKRAVKFTSQDKVGERAGFCLCLKITEGGRSTVSVMTIHERYVNGKTIVASSSDDAHLAITQGLPMSDFSWNIVQELLQGKKVATPDSDKTIILTRQSKLKAADEQKGEPIVPLLKHRKAKKAADDYAPVRKKHKDRKLEVPEEEMPKRKKKRSPVG